MRITEWDATPDEEKFIGGVMDAVCRPSGKRDLQLITKLLGGIDENWFQDRYLKALFTACFEAATLAYSPETRITVTGVLDAAEKALGETGWSREVMKACSERAGIFYPDEFLEQERPLWWEKGKRPKVQEQLAKADLLLSRPPHLETMKLVRSHLVQAMDAVDQEPACLGAEANPMMDDWEQCLKPLPAEAIISTGMKGMDQVLGGGLSGKDAPAGGKLIIVTARPGMGKTQLALNLGMRVALGGHKVVMWSMEMQRKQIHHRLFAALDFMSCRQQGATIGGKLTYAMVSKQRIIEHAAIYKRFVDGKPRAMALADSFKTIPGTHSARGIANTMRLFARANTDTRLFIIDHLGLLDTGGAGNKAIAIGEATREIKTTATELGIDVLLLCQLNRSLEMRQEKMPELSDLRDSGRIEEDADVVCGLLRPNYYDPQHDPHDLQIGILKNRQGGTGRFGVCIDNDCCAIYEALDSPI